MRRVVLGSPPNDPAAFKTWAIAAFREIELASYEDTLTVADDLTVSNVSDLRTFDASTATLADVRNFLATFISDMKKRGMKRTQ